MNASIPRRPPRQRRAVFLALVAIVLFAAACWVKYIDIPYYTQETSYWCGAASAQMVLDGDPMNKFVSQTTLYNYINPRNVCTSWASGPQGLTDALNHYKPSGYYFEVTALSDQDEAVKKLAYTLDQYGVPPISLIYGCAHWVVVRGVITDVQPTANPSYTIYGFWVNDPWYGSTSLGESEYIDISDWKSSYYTGCTWCARTGSRYISVVDPDPPPEVQIIYPEVRQRRDNPLEKREILELATEYRLQFRSEPHSREQFSKANEALDGTQLGEPLFVRRTDREQSGYFIVPMNRGELTSGAMRLDAYSGQLLGVTHTRRPIRYEADLRQDPARDLFKRKLPTLEVRPEVLKKVRPDLERTSMSAALRPIRSPVRQPVVRPDTTRMSKVREFPTFDRLEIGAQDLRITRMELVWQPSDESQNPYYPLWSVEGTVRGLDRSQVLGYVNPKGDVLSRLTPVSPLKGGGGW